ncbi:hypothetical protein MTO96_006720 [Rhipicephalus appendiculatus]
MNLCYTDQLMAEFFDVDREPDEITDAAFRKVHEKERELKKRQNEIQAVLEDLSVKLDEHQDTLNRLKTRMQRLREVWVNRRRGVRMDNILKPSS